MTDEERQGNENENLTNEETPVNEAEENDTTALVMQVKEEMEKRITSVTAEYEKRLKERDKIIRELMAGEEAPKPQKHIYDDLNEARKRQMKKW